MNLFSTRYTVRWHHATETDVEQDNDDGYGSPEITHTPPLDEDGTEVKVYCWAPAGSAEPDTQRVEHDLDLYVPPGTQCTPRDVVDIDAKRYAVVGEAADYTTSPYTPGWGGIVIRLKRVTR